MVHMEPKEGLYQTDCVYKSVNKGVNKLCYIVKNVTLSDYNVTRCNIVCRHEKVLCL